MFDLLPYLGLFSPLAFTILGIVIGRALMRSAEAREAVVFMRPNCPGEARCDLDMERVSRSPL